MSVLLQGLLFGLAYVAPIGTQNLYVINSATQKDGKKVILTTFLVIIFDISLAISCYIGIGVLLNRYNFLKQIILLIGSAVIFYIAIELLRSKVKVEVSIEDNINIKEVILASFSVTWLNPQAIIDGSLLLGGFKSSIQNEMSVYFILGVCLASIVWFSLVAFMVHKFIGKFQKVVKYINIICAIILMLYGLKLLYIFFAGIL